MLIIEIINDTFNKSKNQSEEDIGYTKFNFDFFKFLILIKIFGIHKKF